ncbi:Protein CBG17938 [Caenorhabditis briggsae]|uniref:Serpentine receptor class gamma n=1 Tax=Caenorhabditis briggsae TaxID=6238 RepID=A8XRY3_CAEBR|nr:Protein CBG17938 [Caenorhabditis briggsae]CAP35472.1 Protein CBG17938 [Caenorhabditis briggsae]
MSLLTFLISFSYSLPSIILYFLTIYIILKHRKYFNSSFFILYIFDGIMNIFTFLNLFYMMRLSSITCENCLFSFLYKIADDYVPMTFLMAMTFHMAYVQYSITALISFNRLPVLWNYTIMEPIWKKFAWLIILIVFALPFLDTYRCFSYKTEINYDNETNHYQFLSPMPVTLGFQYLLPTMVIITLLSVFINIISLTTITCAVQLLGCSLSVARVFLASNPIVKSLSPLIPFVSDGLTLVQPWLLVFFSKAMRNKLIGMFRTRTSSVNILQ